MIWVVGSSLEFDSFALILLRIIVAQKITNENQILTNCARSGQFAYSLKISKYYLIKFKNFKFDFISLSLILIHYWSMV